MTNNMVQLKIRLWDGGLREIKVRVGENLGRVLASQGLLPLPCGGRGLCGQCIVKVSGRVSEPTGNELMRRLGSELRLACQTIILGEAVVELVYKPQLRVSSLSVNIPIRKPRPIYESIRVGDRIYPKNNRGLPVILRRELLSNECKYYTSIFNIIAGCSKSAGKNILLVDIGTTKIAYQVVDSSGNLVSESVRLNPLIKYGLDIITRLSKILEDRELGSKMTLELRNSIRSLVDEEVVLMAIAGNSAMESILLGLPIEQLAVKPFQPFIKGPFIDLDLGKPSYIAPMIGGFVGGDAYANLALTEYMKLEKPYMIIDIGTNTEIIVVTGREEGPVYATSTPAGPAFEGHIESGVGVYQPGISRVEIAGFNDKGEPLFKYRVEGKGKPMGLLGSGVISIVSELLRHGLISSNGRIIRGYQRVNGVKTIVIARGEETATGRPIVFSQKDVREVQKALAAVKTGWQILLEEAGVGADRLKWVYVTGMFGLNIRLEDLLLLGVVPSIDRNKIVIAGNTVLAGLKTLVLDREHEEYMRGILGKTIVVDLTSNPKFNNIWLANLKLGQDSSQL